MLASILSTTLSVILLAVMAILIAVLTVQDVDDSLIVMIRLSTIIIVITPDVTHSLEFKIGVFTNDSHMTYVFTSYSRANLHAAWKQQASQQGG